MAYRRKNSNFLQHPKSGGNWSEISDLDVLLKVSASETRFGVIFRVGGYGDFDGLMGW